MIRVFHADDSDSYRRLLEVLLAGDDAIELCGAAADAAGTVEGVAVARPDVVLLDQLGDASLVARVRAAAPGTKVVVLSGTREPELAPVADACVVKAPDLRELRETVLRLVQ